MSSQDLVMYTFMGVAFLASVYLMRRVRESEASAPEEQERDDSK